MTEETTLPITKLEYSVSPTKDLPRERDAIMYMKGAQEITGGGVSRPPRERAGGKSCAK